jgi:hypothetical protein
MHCSSGRGSFVMIHQKPVLSGESNGTRLEPAVFVFPLQRELQGLSPMRSPQVAYTVYSSQVMGKGGSLISLGNRGLPCV